MRRWIVALIAVAFLAGGPALAGGKSGGKCGGTMNSNYQSQQMSAGACAQAMKAGSCGQAAAGRGSMMNSGCVQAMGAGRGMGMSCGSMANGGSCCSSSRAMHVSHDPSNIWYRGPAPRASMAGWVGDGGRCGQAMNSGSKMACGQTAWKAGTGMTCGTGGPHARSRTAWKSGRSANTVTPKGGCCAGRGAKA